MRRTFAIDVLSCAEAGPSPAVGGNPPPNNTRKILDCLGLPSRAPPVAAAAPETEDDPLGTGFTFSVPDCDCE